MGVIMFLLLGVYWASWISAPPGGSFPGLSSLLTYLVVKCSAESSRFLEFYLCLPCTLLSPGSLLTLSSFWGEKVHWLGLIFASVCPVLETLKSIGTDSCQAHLLCSAFQWSAFQLPFVALESWKLLVGFSGRKVNPVFATPSLLEEEVLWFLN